VEIKKLISKKTLQMKNEIVEKLKYFVIRQSCAENEILTNATKIEVDLGVHGDEAFEFLVAYGKKFSLDVSKGGGLF